MANQPKRLPTPTEALDGLKLSSANARRLLTSADAIANTGNYGPAAAMTVLALEESVKARALGAIAVAGARVAIPEATLRKVVFQGHQERHDLGLVQHLVAELFQTPGLDTAKAQKAQALLKGANRIKQAGLYTDFAPDTSSWATPDEVTKTECDEYREFAETYQAETERQIAKLPK